MLFYFCLNPPAAVVTEFRSFLTARKHNVQRQIREREEQRLQNNRRRLVEENALIDKVRISNCVMQGN